jgi:hypothetical protein
MLSPVWLLSPNLLECEQAPAKAKLGWQFFLEKNEKKWEKQFSLFPLLHREGDWRPSGDSKPINVMRNQRNTCGAHSQTAKLSLQVSKWTRVNLSKSESTEKTTQNFFYLNSKTHLHVFGSCCAHASAKTTCLHELQTHQTVLTSCIRQYKLLVSDSIDFLHQTV